MWHIGIDLEPLIHCPILGHRSWQERRLHCLNPIELNYLDLHVLSLMDQRCEKESAQQWNTCCCALQHSQFRLDQSASEIQSEWHIYCYLLKVEDRWKDRLLIVSERRGTSHPHPATFRVCHTSLSSMRLTRLALGNERESPKGIERCYKFSRGKMTGDPEVRGARDYVASKSEERERGRETDVDGR